MMASNSLRIIREVKGFATVSLVRSIMEYRAVIRQCSRHTGKLSSIQRKALSLCLGLPSTSGAELVGIAAGVLHIDLYFTQIAIKEMAKIQAKSISRPTRWQKIKVNTANASAFLPLKLKKWKYLTNVDIRTMEPELEYEKDSLLMSTKTPVYWSILGTSKSWMLEQQELGKEIVLVHDGSPRRHSLCLKLRMAAASLIQAHAGQLSTNAITSQYVWRERSAREASSFLVNWWPYCWQYRTSFRMSPVSVVV